MEKLSTQARVSEIGDLALRWVELYRKSPEVNDDRYLRIFFDELEKLSGQITDAVKRETVFSKLEDADAQRDKALRALGKIFSGYKNIALPHIQQHGEKLSEVFKKYGAKTAQKSYSEETHLIESLLKELQKPDMMLSVSALMGVSEAVAELRMKQDAFAEVRSKYDDSVAKHQTSPSASTLKKPLFELINKKLVTYLSAMEIVEKEKFGGFVASSNQIIDSINTNIKARTKKEKAAKEKPGEKAKK